MLAINFFTKANSRLPIKSHF